ncbi:hypothetical protein [Microcoleus sp. B3-D7]|uniref:hypothetical protein n=1 Tax=Microcoleus sp. B3-D7 TaxID=2818659 RepID=UPI002FD69CEF
MTEKKSVTFRCDADLLEAIDKLGRERYPAKTPHGCDRSKILMEVLRLNIGALSDGSVILREPAKIRQHLSDNLDERIAEIIERKTQPLLSEIANIKASQASAIAQLRAELGELAA